jgi:hypothetical protein
VCQEDITDRNQALAWFAAEHRVLIAATDLAARTGFYYHAWRIFRILALFMWVYRLDSQAA